MTFSLKRALLPITLVLLSGGCSDDPAANSRQWKAIAAASCSLTLDPSRCGGSSRYESSRHPSSLNASSFQPAPFGASAITIAASGMCPISNGGSPLQNQYISGLNKICLYG